MTIRDASPSDAAALAELLSQLGYPVTAAEALRRLRRARARVLLAEDDDQIVGLLALEVRHPIDHPGPVARVAALVVSEGARRRGVGRALMERAATIARASGCEGVELTTGLWRRDAHHFYEALGYERTSYRFWRGLP